MPPDSRPDTQPISVSQLMTESQGGFARILQRARALDRLGQKVSGLLDDDLARRCTVANVRRGQLIFACSSAGAATRLRMQSQALLEQLHAVGLDKIESIEVKMVPPA